MVKVSVIVPVYNEEKYLEKCLKSICTQTLKDIEMICVDDGSTDRSPQILESYAEKDKRIKILTQKNRFAGVARNYGMKHASGEYLSFLDADDYFEADMLEKMYQRAQEEQSDIVICRYREYCEKSKAVRNRDWSFIDSFFYEKRKFSGGELKYAGIFQITRGWAWDKLFRRDFVKQCNYEFPDFRSSEDGYFVYMLLVCAKNISYLDDIFVTHRINNFSSLSNTREKNWINGFKMLLLIKRELERLNLYPIYWQSFLNEVVYFLIGYVKSMNSFEAFRDCYAYIQNVIEPEIGILDLEPKQYILKEKEFFGWYKSVIQLSLAEYLFQERQKNMMLLNQQRESLDRLTESYKEKAWVFPYHLIEKGKTVVLYGAGKIGKCYHSQLIASQYCKEVIWVDKQYKKYIASGETVRDPAVVEKLKFDYVFLAIRDYEVQEEIKEWLLEKGVSPEQIRCFGQNER